LVSRPYIDSNTRHFSKEVNQEDLVWHRDREDRLVISVELTDWLIQLEGELPTSLNSIIKIDKFRWHRLIKGSGHLNIKIIKI